MKKVLYTLAALSFVFVACNKQEIVPEEGSSQEGELTTVTIKASNGDADTKAAISDALAFTWTAGDQIAVCTSTESGMFFYESNGLASGGSSSAEFTVPLRGTRTGFAVYPASVASSWDGTNLTLVLPSEYKLAEVSGDKSPLPMIATNSEALSFYHVAGLLRLTISGIPAEATRLRIGFNGRKVSGDFAIVEPSAGSSTIASVDGTLGLDDYIWVTRLSSTTSATINLPLPTGVDYNNLAIIAYNGATPLKAQLTAFTYSASRAYGKKVYSTLSLDPLGFSIDGEGHQVKFAPGNLQYKANTNTWRFAPTQFSYVGNGGTTGNVTGSNNESIASNYSGWIDLFGWATSGFNEKYPYKKPASAEQAVYTADSQTYGPTGLTDGQQWYEGVTGDEKYDWGKNNTIGSDPAETWRTLTSTDWNYIITGRPIVFYRYAKGKIGAVNGLFIFPDGYVHPHSRIPIVSPDTPDSGYTSNQFTVDQWTKMAEAGAVFLPSAGIRGASGKVINTDEGHYWTSTVCSDEPNSSGSLARARKLAITPGDVSPNGYGARYIGASVRLVRDLN